MLLFSKQEQEYLKVLALRGGDTITMFWSFRDMFPDNLATDEQLKAKCQLSRRQSKERAKRGYCVECGAMTYLLPGESRCSECGS